MPQLISFLLPLLLLPLCSTCVAQDGLNGTPFAASTPWSQIQNKLSFHTFEPGVEGARGSMSWQGLTSARQLAFTITTRLERYHQQTAQAGENGGLGEYRLSSLKHNYEGLRSIFGSGWKGPRAGIVIARYGTEHAIIIQPDGWKTGKAYLLSCQEDDLQEIRLNRADAAAPLHLAVGIANHCSQINQ